MHIYRYHLTLEGKERSALGMLDYIYSIIYMYGVICMRATAQVFPLIICVNSSH
jgi:hypothetical protein